jgi:hypothetical protein
MLHKIDAKKNPEIVKIENELKKPSNISSSFTFTVSDGTKHNHSTDKR